MTIELRAAAPTDANDMARLVDQAGEGLPQMLWQSMAAEREDVWDVGAARARRDEGAFSWRNATVAEVDNHVAGLLIVYEIGPEPVAPSDEMPTIFRPLADLENRALSTLYVNVLAVYPRHRQQGVARALMQRAVELAGPQPLSLIVADGNVPARALYASLGFSETARRPVVRDGWKTDNTEWILLIRPVK
ncbi:GNAT family N-acetyltransferase [Aestuariibius sp. 2305UL40-4]|uniref:GNAT family N-acetyltransferase n=1 Tax=Aestuariibius violaceus TaxID=3234132 RepID=UPI00345EC497